MKEIFRELKTEHSLSHESKRFIRNSLLGGIIFGAGAVSLQAFLDHETHTECAQNSPKILLLKEGEPMLIGGFKLIFLKNGTEITIESDFSQDQVRLPLGTRLSIRHATELNRVETTVLGKEVELDGVKRIQVNTQTNCR